MGTIAVKNTESTKKLIELPNDICRKLAVQAAAMGMSVKRLIESMVINSIEASDDEALYAYMLETRPEGKEMLSDEEQSELLAKLREKAQSDEV